MKSIVSIWIVLTITAVVVSKSAAQTYPVQVVAQVSPPYSPFLSDYTAIGSQRLLVNIVLNDPTLTEYRGKLRITIEGVGITIRTKPGFVPQQPLMLQGGGIPLQLYGEDLEEYFNPANLDFAGITKGQYEKGARLPEGVYRFTFEVLDYNRNTVVSNKGMSVAWIILNDPPLLNLPRTETKVRILDPANIAFTWTPRHTGSPNSAFTTEYIFRLVEIWPANRNPYDAFLSQQPLYETTTDFTQLVYGPAEPALIPGRKYAWQVQAKDAEGRDLFKNQGKSEVYVFQFGDALGAPEGLHLQSANPASLTVRWEQNVAGADAISYRVRYRPHNNRTHENWYEEQTENQWAALSQLKPNTEYEVQVRSVQITQASDYCPVKVFKTTAPSANDFACRSDVSPPPVPANKLPALELGAEDTIHAGGFDVLVQELTASANGVYTGKGLAIVPWFKYARVKVTFERIGVNEQQWLTNGEIKSVWNPDSKFLFKNITEVEKDNAAKTGEIEVTVVETETLIEVTGAAIVSVTKNEDGDFEVVTSDGKTQKLEKGKSYSIVDEVGNGYVVDKAGNITKTTATEAKKAAARGDRNYTIALKFEKGEGKFGFDEKRYDALASYYQQLEGGEYIPWKAVSSLRPDPVAATLEGTDIDPKKVRFEIDGTTVSPATIENDRYTLNLSGKSEGTVEELLALYTPSEKEKDNVLGKLNLVSYDQLSRNLVIVPVNETPLPDGLTASTLQEELNAIYGQAVADWKVSMASPIVVTFDRLFDDGESGLLSNYTGDMKKVIKAFGNLQDNTYYLFLVTKPTSGKDAKGYMPRSKQAGFIFADNLNSSDIVTTIAHELGHGAFSLQHTFSEFALNKGSTDNLMDYAEGRVLYKYQWDYVHDPQKVLALFEGDEDGEKKTIDQNKFSVYICDSLTQSGKIYYQSTDSCIIHVFVERKDTTITQAIVKLKISITGTKNKIEKSYTLTSFGQKQQITLDSLPKGKYEFACSLGSESLKQWFFYRKEKFSYACNVCGRDLTVTHARLKSIFTDGVTNQDANWFNQAMKTAGFNTCKKQLHVFSQIKVETGNFTKFIEGLNYRPSTFFATFVNNCNLKTFYNQDFWANKTYKKYFSYKVYEFDTLGTGTKYKGSNEIKYTWNPNTNASTQEAYCIGVVKAAGDTIRIPTNFALPGKSETGQYKEVSYTDAQKVESQKKLMSLTYANRMGNGDSTTQDGYNFRGRGAVQLTGREAYQKVTQKTNSLFNTNYNWETNYQELETNKQAIIYSGIAFFAWKLSNNLEYLQNNNCKAVSKKVNGGENGLPERKAAFNLLLNADLYDCTISKE